MDAVPDFEACAISAADILTTNIVRILGSLNYRRNGVTQEATAFRAIQWGLAILPAIGGSRLHRAMARLRSSRLRKSDSWALVPNPFDVIIGRIPDTPSDFERRRAHFARFSLIAYPTFPDWLPIIRRPEATLVPPREI